MPDESPLSTLPLLTIDEQGAVPETRIKDVAAARQLFTRLRDDDDASARNRAIVQGMIDGANPYLQSELDAAGLTEITNVNFGGGESQVENALAGYTDIVHSPESLVRVPVTVGEDRTREEHTSIISEEISRTFKEWGGFTFETLRICQEHIVHGLGTGVYDDALDWRYRGVGLKDMLFPRQSLLCEDDLEFAARKQGFPVWHLYQKIKDPESAELLGWNVPAVRRAIAKATPRGADYSDWETLQAEFKNNDLSYTASQNEVKCVSLFVREFNGGVTHYVFTEDPCNRLGSVEFKEEFLYTRRYAFDKMPFVIFPYGLGTNSSVHGLRGLGHKIFAIEQVQNRLRSKAVDAAFLASSLMIKPNSEEALNDLALSPFGGFTVLNPNMSLEPFQMPSYDSVVSPVLNDMDRLLSQRTGSYSIQNSFGGERKTRFEVAARIDENAKLSDTALEFFYAPFTRLLRESVRRMTRRDYHSAEPGGRAIAEMKKRIVKRGVPLESFYSIDVDALTVTRAIGRGSSASRALALQQLEEMAPALDDVGRHNLRRDRIVTITGVAQADRYITRQLEPRIPSDVKVAMLENESLIQGAEIPVLPNELHVPHAETHLQKLGEIAQAVDAGELPIEEAAPMMMPLFNHASEHVQRIAGDFATMNQAAVLRQALQQVGEVISNGMKKVAAMQRKAAEEGPDQGAEGAQDSQDQGVDIEAMMKMERHRADMQHRQEKHELEISLAIQKAQTQRAIEDIKAASKIGSLLKK